MKKVLIVDDECEHMGDLFPELEKHFDVTFVPDERQALEALKKNHIDVVLMDGNLGYQLEGRHVVRRLRTSECTLPIYMFSADERMNEEGVRDGATGSFHKKWSDPTMPSRLAEFLLQLHP